MYHWRILQLEWTEQAIPDSAMEEFIQDENLQVNSDSNSDVESLSAKSRHI